MWDDIIYGDGDKLCGSTHIPSLKIKESISQNSVAYWIADCILGVGMTVFKNTPQGESIKKLIDDKDYEALSLYLDKLVLTGLSVQELKKKIKEFGEDQFDSGRESIKKEMRKLLGLKF